MALSAMFKCYTFSAANRRAVFCHSELLCDLFLPFDPISIVVVRDHSRFGIDTEKLIYERIKVEVVVFRSTNYKRHVAACFGQITTRITGTEE